MTRVLLVDDDVELASMLREYLQREGFETTAVHDGEAGAREALSGGYAIVVLDVMLPRLSGVEALRRIRMQSRVPVLMLTAKGDDVELRVVANMTDALAIRQILEHLDLGRPEKPPPEMRDVVRGRVDDEGREIDLQPA